MDNMTQNNTTIEALEYILNLTNQSDWYLLHNTVRTCVREGKITKDEEQIYKDIVDKKINNLNT